MSEPAPLRRASVVDALADALRVQILEGALPAGAPLREVELAGAYAVSRHTLRAALRQLAAEGVVTVEPNRGARVARLGRAEVVGLWELRTALEVEAAHLALERHGGRPPREVERAVARLSATCERPRASWRAIAAAHAEVHEAIVRGAESPRLSRAYDGLRSELGLFLVQLRPVFTAERMAAHHEQLLAGLGTEGPVALRRHLREGAEAVLADLDAAGAP